MHGLNITIPSYLYQSHIPGAEIVLDFVVKAFLTIRINFANSYQNCS